MRVIVDLHGGWPDDPVAKTEFEEIKERVILEASCITASSTDKPLIPQTVARERRGENVRCDVATVQAPRTACHVLPNVRPVGQRRLLSYMFTL